MLRDGNANCAPLNPNLKIYIEYANELWNTGYWEQWAWLKANSKTVPALKYDGESDENTLAFRYQGMRTIQISDIFRQVFGDSQMPAPGKDPASIRIRPVVCHQKGYIDIMNRTMTFIDKYYNKRDSRSTYSDPHPVNYYLYGFGASTYFNPAGSPPALTIDNIWSTGEFVAANHYNSIKVAANIAREFGLADLAYEGGQHPQYNGDEVVTRVAAMDPRMEAKQVEMHQVFNQVGGELNVLNQLIGKETSISPQLTEGHFDILRGDIGNLDRPRYNAVLDINNSTPVPITLGSLAPFTRDGHDFDIESTWGVTPGSGSYNITGNNFDYSTAYSFRVPSTGGYKVQIGYSTNASATLVVEYDGNVVGTFNLNSTGGASAFTSYMNINCSTDKLHSVRLVATYGTITITKIIVETGMAGSGDTQAPTVPSGLTPSNITQNSFTLSWTASTDSVGVTGYEVFKDGSSIGTTSSTSMDVTGLTCGTTYAMTVRSQDAVPNWSAQSSALNVSTSACGNVGDTITPTVPTSLVSSNITRTSFNLSWAASTDSVGVTGYEVFKDGASIGTTSSTSMDVTGLTCGTTYAMTVRAQDAVPNWSAQSTSLDIKTTGCTSLIGYWSFDETSGSIASDGSGNGNDGTLQGNATFAPGKLGNAISLDGTNSWVDIPNLSFTGDFTIAAWVYLTGTVNYQDALVGQDVWGQDINFCCPNLRLYTGSGDAIVSNSSVSSSTWTHCAITRSGGTLSVYIDGSLDNTSTGFTDPFTPQTIGKGAQGALTEGLIDEVYLYDRSLDASEIQDLFTGGNTGGSSDTEAPTVPTGLSSSNITGTSFTLSWAASTDNVGVTGYEVFKDGSSIGTTSTTSMNVTGLTCNTTHTMTVRAQDAAHNWSAQSTSSDITTTDCASPSLLELNPVADAYVRGGASGDINYGNDTILFVKNGITDDYYTRESFIKFDLSSVEGTVGSATLKLYVRSAEVGTSVHTITLVNDDSWMENTITFNNRPTSLGSVVSTFNVTSIGEYSIDVTSAVQSESDGVLSLKIETDGDLGITCYTKEASQNIPVLEINLSDGAGDNAAPSVPAGLSASNVVPTSFTLSWNASTDNVGVTGYEVFKDGSSIGTTSSTSMDVTGLTCGSTYTMTVKARDAVPNWSAQSTSLDIKTTSCTSLIGYWSFDETSGSTASDGSGNGNDGTLQGNATFAPGKLGNAISLDGTNSWVDIPNLSFTGDFTIAAWVYLTGTIDNQDALVGQDVWGQDINFCCPNLRLFTGSGDAIASSSSISSGTWTHCAITRSGGTMSVYIDGSLDNTSTGFTDPFTPQTIGKGAQGALTEGLIDEVYLYNRSLDASEIQDLFTDGNTGSSSDTEAPTVPTGLSSSNITGTSFTLSWAASTDNVGVTGYEVFQDGSAIGTTSSTSMDVTGLTCGSTYTMTVRAQDDVPNWSAQSPAQNVSTSVCDSVGDTIAPTVPLGLTSSNITQNSFTLSWTASADSVGVTGYEVFQDGISIGATSSTLMDVTGLTCGTTYVMTVRARDAAANWSAQSTSSDITTADCTSPSLLELNPVADAYVRGGASGDINYGSDTILVLKNGLTDDYTRETFLKFDLSSVPATVGSATLKLYAHTVEAGTSVLTVTQVNDDSWTESTITFNNRPTSLGSVVSTYNVASAGEFSIDVTSAVQSESDGMLSLKIETDANLGVTYFSKEASQNIPVLEINLSDGAGDIVAPSVPTGLSALNVAPTSFTLSWTASTDAVGVTGYEVFQDGVSIGTTSSTSMDVTGLSPGNTYAMTVRAQDVVPNWSAQSSALNVTTESTTAVNSVGIDITGITVFPNPAKDEINLSLISASNDDAIVNIVNIGGRVVINSVYPIVVGPNNIKMNASSLKSGIYFIKVVVGKDSYRSKIIINK